MKAADVCRHYATLRVRVFYFWFMCCYPGYSTKSTLEEMQFKRVATARWQSNKSSIWWGPLGLLFLSAERRQLRRFASHLKRLHQFDRLLGGGFKRFTLKGVWRYQSRWVMRVLGFGVTVIVWRRNFDMMTVDRVADCRLLISWWGSWVKSWTEMKRWINKRGLMRCLFLHLRLTSYSPEDTRTCLTSNTLVNVQSQQHVERSPHPRGGLNRPL